MFPTIMVSMVNLVFMDSYGTGQQTSFFHVPEEGYLVHAKGSGQIYQTLRCSLRFRTFDSFLAHLS